MLGWVIIAALAVVVTVVLVLLPWRIHLRLQGRGEPNGAWALAGAVKTGPVLITGVAARGVPARAEAALFGRTLWSSEEKDEDTEDDEARAKKHIERARGGYSRVERFFDPVELVAFALGERRRVQLESVEADLDYSFADVILTGKLLGALYALNGALPEQVVIRQRASWDSEDRAEIAATGKIRVWPGLLLVDTVVFVIRHVKLRRREPPPAGEASPS